MKNQNRSHYVVITKNAVHVSDSLKGIQKATNGQIDAEEFKSIGKDFIVNLNDDDLDFIQDKKRMMNIPWAAMLTKDKSINYLIYAVMALNVIILIRG